MAVWSPPLQDGSEGSAFISRSAWRSRAFLTQHHHGFFLPAAACGGLRSAPDHRTRRALLHLSYSCAPQITHAVLVTHDPIRTSQSSLVWRRHHSIIWFFTL